MKKGWLKNIFKGMCLTSAVFVFQACYGTPQDFGQDVHVNGVVKSKKTGEPIKGIKVSVGLLNSNYSKEQYEFKQHGHTDESGRFSLYIYETDKVLVSFEDIDSADSKNYATKDTIFTVSGSEIVLNIELEEK
jgi:hypothetical protein